MASSEGPTTKHSTQKRPNVSWTVECTGLVIANSTGNATEAIYGKLKRNPKGYDEPIIALIGSSREKRVVNWLILPVAYA
jgi:hypothetical protein